MSCLRTERIVDEVFELSVEQPMSDAAAKHLAGCEVCQDELDRARRLRAGLRDVKAPQGFAARVAARIATIETSGPARAQRVVSPDPGMELTPTGGWRQRRRFAWGQWLAVAASLMVCGLAWAAVVWLTGDGPPRRAASTSPLVAALTPPTVVQRLEVTVEAPAWCRRGDELVVEPVILASTSLEADLQVTVLVSEPLATIGRASIRAQLRHGVVTPALAFAVGTRGAGRGTVTVVVEPVAREVREWASERFEASTTLEVLEVTREVSLARSAELGGPLSRVTLIPHSDALQLDEPRRASIRVIPGLAAEAELNLRSLVRRPHGCFEQTTAATYVSAMVAKLAADGRTAEDVAVAAQRAAEEGAERLKRFQMPDGGFSLHGRGPSVPWLTALGLAQMADLREVVKVDPERVGAARVALLASRTAEGSFAIPAWRDGRGGPAGPESDLAATAYAAWALLRAGVSADELTETLDWLRASMAQSGEDAYEIAMVARTLIAAGRTGGTQAEQDALDDATDLSARLVELAEVNKRDNALAWRATRTLTGTRGRLAAIETTALAVQVLRDTGSLELAQEGLRAMTTLRRASGFGGTQAIVEALRAQVGVGATASGELTVELGGLPVATLTIEDGDREPLFEAPVALAGVPASTVARMVWDKGVEVTFRGQGSVTVELVITGTIPFGATVPGGQPQTGPAPLQVRVQRIKVGGEDATTRWIVNWENRSPDWVASPMVSLGLPAATVIVGTGIEDAITRGHLYAAHVRGESLDLYLADLAPGASGGMTFWLLSDAAGEYAHGPVFAYPYYDDERETCLPPSGDAPRLAALPPAREPSTSAAPAAGGTDAAPRVAESPAAAARAAALVRLPKPKEETKVFVIGWDPELGPLRASELFPNGATLLDRMVGRALYRGLPEFSNVREVERGRLFQFDLHAVKWEGGGRITSTDVTSTWAFMRAELRAQRQKRHGQLLDALDLRQLELLDTLEARAVGSTTVEVRLPRSWSREELVTRLSCAPFLPRPQERRGDNPRKWGTNGPYEVSQWHDQGIALKRRVKEGAKKIVFATKVKSGQADVSCTAEPSNEPSAFHVFATASLQTSAERARALSSVRYCVQRGALGLIGKGLFRRSASPARGSRLHLVFERPELGRRAPGLAFALTTNEIAVTEAAVGLDQESQSPQYGAVTVTLRVNPRTGFERRPLFLGYLPSRIRNGSANLSPSSFDDQRFFNYPPRFSR